MILEIGDSIIIKNRYPEVTYNTWDIKDIYDNNFSKRSIKRNISYPDIIYENTIFELKDIIKNKYLFKRERFEQFLILHESKLNERFESGLFSYDKKTRRNKNLDIFLNDN